MIKMNNDELNQQLEINAASEYASTDAYGLESEPTQIGLGG